MTSVVFTCGDIPIRPLKIDKIYIKTAPVLLPGPATAFKGLGESRNRFPERPLLRRCGCGLSFARGPGSVVAERAQPGLSIRRRSVGGLTEGPHAAASVRQGCARGGAGAACALSGSPFAVLSRMGDSSSLWRPCSPLPACRRNTPCTRGPDPWPEGGRGPVAHVDAGPEPH